MRINKFISLNSAYSRRKADQLIKDGKVKINGETLKQLGVNIDVEKDSVEIDAKKIKIQSEKIYIALNKPAGYISTRSDELNRKTVMELLPKIDNLKPVGRLDKETEGLLIFTNDGELINQLTHPRFECDKEYYLEVKGELTDEKKEKLEKGITIENKKTKKAKIKILKKTKEKTIVIITIQEGRKRQIRKMFDYVKLPVKYLKRIRIGKLKLDSLKKGEYKFLNKKDINAD